MRLQPPQQLRSFRFRIAALSTALSGFVLVAFCTSAWLVIQRVNLHRVDEDIRRTGMFPLSLPQPPPDWTFVEESLRFVLGEEEGDPAILLVKGRQNEILYQSSNWPNELSPDAFAPPGGPEPPPLPEPMEFVSPPQPPQPQQPPEMGEMRGDQPGVRGPRGPRPWDGPRPGPRNQPGAGPAEGRGPGPGEAFFEGPGPGPGGGRVGGRGPGRGEGFFGMRFRNPGGPPPAAWPIETHAFYTQIADGREWRIGVMSNPYVTFVLGRNMGRFWNEMNVLRNVFLLALPLALALIAAGGWWLAQRALRPIRALTAAAEGITARGLDQRIPMRDEDAEFNRLISVFNGMMDRLERSFQQAVRFSADAAHELKTPLTILQGELEQALQAAPAGSAQQETFGTLLEEVQRLKAVNRKLLLLSLADSGQLKPHLEPLDLTTALEEAVEDTQILAPGITIEQEIEAGVWVAADKDLLRQVLQNLTSNAIKYNHPKGLIRFMLRRAGNQVRLTVANTGSGIPREDRDKVFERFYRADKARNRAVDGTGLGLSLSREIARAHRGDLVLENTREGTAAFTLVLPAAEPAG